LDFRGEEIGPERGIATPKSEIDVLTRRRKQAEAHHKSNYPKGHANEPN